MAADPIAGATVNTADLLKSFPGVPWKTPVPIKVLGREKRWACRLCLVQIGVKASAFDATPFLFKDMADCTQHIETAHPCLQQMQQ